MLKLLLLLPSILLSWTFTETDYQRLSPTQKSNLDIVYLVGEEKGHGLRLAAKAIVENMARNTDNNPNHICGILQVDVTLVKETCKQLESNVYIAARVGLEQFLDWKTKDTYVNGKLVTTERTDDKATMMYNVGYTKDPFAKTHLKKVHIAEKVLRKHYAN